MLFHTISTGVFSILFLAALFYLSYRFEERLETFMSLWHPVPSDLEARGFLARFRHFGYTNPVRTLRWLIGIAIGIAAFETVRTVIATLEQ